MNSLERVIAAVKFQEADRPPVTTAEAQRIDRALEKMNLPMPAMA